MIKLKFDWDQRKFRKEVEEAAGKLGEEHVRKECEAARREMGDEGKLITIDQSKIKYKDGRVNLGGISAPTQETLDKFVSILQRRMK
jgi:hypothetical protein